MDRILFLCACVALLFNRLAAAEEPTVDKPLRTLRESHPRLVITANDVEALNSRRKTDKTLTAWYATIRREADNLLKKPVSRYEIPDGKRLLRVSRRVVQRTQTLGLCFLMEREPQHKDRLWRELAAAAAFKDWNPSHFLDTAEMTHAFAIGYDWLYEDWSDEQRQALRQAMITHGLTPGLNSYRGDARYGWWSRSHHNWNQVCNGGMVLGALAIAEDEPELADEIVRAAVASLPRAMASYAPDGAWGEGPGYWHYATHYNVLALAALESELGSDFGLADHDGFDQTGGFPIYTVGPTRLSFNFADCKSSSIPAPELFWLARRFDRPSYAMRQLQFAKPEPLDLIWFAQLRQPPTASQLPLHKYYRNSEVAIMRGSWDEDAVFVGFKAGDNKFNHSNLDIGSFVLDAGGVRWAVDLGSDDYNMPGYFGGQRWTYYRMRAEGHNTLLINPDADANQDPKAVARITKFTVEPGKVEAIADLTPAYSRNAENVERRVQLIDDRAVQIDDRVAAAQPIELWWLMHTAAEIAVSPDGQSAVLKQDGKQLLVQMTSVPPARLSVLEAIPLPTSPNPSEQAENPGVRKLTIHLSNVKSAHIKVRFELDELKPDSR